MSFTAAAHELSVTQGAISRHIKSLETYLRVALFRRLPRVIELTPEGSLYYPALREALDTMERATRRLLNGNQDRVITLSVLPTLAMSWIIPRLSEFNALHPSFEIHLVTSILPADFSTETDMAIRVGARKSPRIGARKSERHEDTRARINLVMTEDWTGIEAEYLMPDILMAVCSPDLVRGMPPLREVADLRHHTLLHNGTRPHAWADWLREVGLNDIDASAGPTYGHFFMALQAAAQGKGVACVPSILVANDLAAGRLVAPFNRQVESAGGYYLLYRERDADVRKIHIFREWLLAEAAPYRE